MYKAIFPNTALPHPTDPHSFHIYTCWTIPSIVILGCAEKVYASLGRLCKDLIEPPKRVFESNYKRFLHLFLVAAVIFDHLIDA